MFASCSFFYVFVGSDFRWFEVSKKNRYRHGKGTSIIAHYCAIPPSQPPFIVYNYNIAQYIFPTTPFREIKYWQCAISCKGQPRCGWVVAPTGRPGNRYYVSVSVSRITSLLYSSQHFVRICDVSTRIKENTDRNVSLHFWKMYCIGLYLISRYVSVIPYRLLLL